ncbi:hypothetical protein KAH55_10595 [bacterium]|nr:hypothetical protein [bacterium]
MIQEKENPINTQAEDTTIAAHKLSQCPSEEMLGFYIKRTVPRRLRHSIKVHLNGCPACRQKIRNIREAQLITYEVEVFNQVLEELDASDSGSLDYLLQARREQQLYQKRIGFWGIWRMRLHRWWRRFR